MKPTELHQDMTLPIPVGIAAPGLAEDPLPMVLPASEEEPSRQALPITGEVRADGLKPGSPGAILMDTVCRPEGATHQELCRAVGWKQCLPNMVRYADKVGVTVTSTKEGTHKRYFGTRGVSHGVVIPKKVKDPTKSKDKAKPKTPAKGKAKTSKTDLVAKMLLREKGCTTAQVLAATGWKAISMPAAAKSAGLELRTEKVGNVTRYYGTKP